MVDAEAVASAVEERIQQRMVHGVLDQGVLTSGSRTRTGSAAIGTSTAVVRSPSQVEVALRLLSAYARDRLRMPGPPLRRRLGVAEEGGASAEEEEEDDDDEDDGDATTLLGTAEAHLACLRSQRAEFLQCRAFLVAQRQFLYAHDEVDQCKMRMMLRAPGEVVKDGEAYRFLILLRCIHPST